VNGITCDKIKVYLGSKEEYPGATYSILSRARSVKDIAILDKYISETRFKNKSFYSGQKLEIREAKRLGIYDKIYNEL